MPLCSYTSIPKSIHKMQPRYAPLPPPFPPPNPNSPKNPPLNDSMPRRSLTRIIHTHKRPIHLAQALETILQRLGHIVREAQLRLLVEHDVHFDPDAVAGVVGDYGFVGVDLGSWGGVVLVLFVVFVFTDMFEMARMIH